MCRTQEFDRTIGKRMLIAREHMGMSRQDVARGLGIKHRQTVANIEKGKRALRTRELAVLPQIFKKPLSFFIDPYVLPFDKSNITWRTNNVSDQTLNKIQNKAISLLAAYKRFGEELSSPHLQSLIGLKNIFKFTSAEWLQADAEALSATWCSGDVPARSLRDAIEKKDILTLMLDLPEGVLAAAFRLDELSAILINRNEAAPIRNFNMAHVLFHLLTWDNIKPRWNDIDFRPENFDKPIEERKADQFASAMLLPRNLLMPCWDKRGDMPLKEWIDKTASYFNVPGYVLFWRLINLGLRRFSDLDPDSLAQPNRSGPPPKLYSKRFVDKLHDVLDKDLVSVEKAAKLLDCSVDDIARISHEQRQRAL